MVFTSRAPLILTPLLASVALLCPASAVAQAGDGLTYSPIEHQLLKRDFPEFPYAVEGLAPGVHIEDAYRSGHYSCRYEEGEVRAHCFVMVRRLGPDSARLSLGLSVDRRTGTVAAVTVEPTGLYWGGPDTPGHKAIRAWTTQMWGEPSDSGTDWVAWVDGECRGDDCSRRAPETREAAMLREADNLHPREKGNGWELILTSGPVNNVLDTADLDTPTYGGYEEHVWYPVWEPVSFRGLMPGMSAGLLARKLGANIRRSLCDPDEVFDELVECRLPSASLTIDGLPMSAKLRIDSAGRAMHVVLEAPRRATEEAATRDLELLKSAVNEDSGTGSWSHPFKLDVDKVRSDGRSVQWWARIWLLTRAAQQDAPAYW